MEPTSLTITSWSAQDAASPKKCKLCRENLKEHERIVNLICLHIFHESCFPAYLMKCPSCSQNIAARIKPVFDTESLKKAINCFLDSFCEAIPIIPRNLLEAGIKNSFNPGGAFANGYNLIEIIQSLNQGMHTILRNSQGSELMKIPYYVRLTAPLLIEYIKFYKDYQSPILSLSSISLFDTFDHCHRHHSNNQQLATYLILLKDALNNHQGVMRILAEVNKAFVNRKYSYLNSLEPKACDKEISRLLDSRDRQYLLADSQDKQYLELRQRVQVIQERDERNFKIHLSATCTIATIACVTIFVLGMLNEFVWKFGIKH